MSLRITLLPTSYGSDSQLQPLTAFLVNDRVAVDAGSLGLSVAPERRADVADVIITHPHIDHTCGLAIHVASAFPTLERPVRVYGTEPVIDALRAHVFNGTIWPDFTRIPLVDSDLPSLEFHTIEENVPFEVAGLRVTPVPVNHVVPTIGLVVEGDGAAVVFTSDTYKTDALWEVANDVENLKAVFIDCSYPSELDWLAETAKHLTPLLILEERAKLERPAHIFAVHIKPEARERVVAEIERLDRPDFTLALIGHEYAW
jgi:cAMP phosphodiesterase